MLASHNWLRELSGLSVDPAEVAKRLTLAGLEVESMRRFGGGLDNVVVAEVRGMRPHPQREKLRLVTLFDGERESEVVCGAPNVPDPGGRVAFAKLGASLPNGLKIEERKLGGVVSSGMICSEVELNLGADGDGILILDSSAQPGAPLTAALGLSDTIYEIGLTPNRPDCLGHVGIARELCALFDKPFLLPPPPDFRALFNPTPALLIEDKSGFGLFEARAHETLTPSAAGSPVRVQISAPDRCPRYGAALVLGVQIAPSPFAFRYRLHTLGLRAISNVVDATNLILLGWGQPIHAFDLRKLNGPSIDVRLAREGEKMHTLDGQERTLTADDLLICDAKGPVALAGVMGGANSEIGPDTRDVLIECAYFDPRSVRRTSKRTGLHTDSSHRFERGVDPHATRAVLADSSALVASLAGGAVGSRALDVYPKPIEKQHVRFRPARAQLLLGREVTAAEAKPVFERLGCEVAVSGSDFDVVVPTHRPDITREADLIEELARVSGYDTIPTVLPVLRPVADAGSSEIAFVRRLREAAVSCGLHEAVNFAMVATSTLEKAKAPQPDRAVRLANPMSEERSVLRTAVLPGLLMNLLTAQRHQQKRFAGFEVSRVFTPTARGALPDERYELAVVLWGLRQSWYEEREELDFYDAKGVMESLSHAVLGERGRTELDAQLADAAPYLHPKRSARVVCGSQAKVGFLGELHPDVVRELDLTGRPAVLVLDVASLLAAARGRGQSPAAALPRFPAATRDLAVVVAESVPAGEVAGVLSEVAAGLAESVRLFDIYRGAPVPDGQKSLAFHVTYRDPSATLTDKRVDEAHAKVAAQAEARFGAAVRK
ncbi:MAG TPA: phenylalanine--tRNA ligase subunit beta [Polyangiales bacterium]|nr:phenylalanine--tRNA ligase subunit beta [Polyangiales bacterium]